MRIKKNHIIALIIMSIMATISVNLYADNVSQKLKNGFLAENLNEIYPPFSKELFGYERLTTDCILYINYDVGLASGIAVCISKGNNIIFIVDRYKDGKVDGEVQFYPNDIFSTKCVAKEGILDGECIMKIQPFLYGKDTKTKLIDGTHDKLYADKVDKNLPLDFKIETTGIFKNGKKFSGEFISSKGLGLYMEIRVEKYKDGKLLSTSEPQYFKTQMRFPKY